MCNGIFIVLYDEDSLSLYLRNGIYGFLMKPTLTTPSKNHFAVLADFACCSKETKVFFFLKRKIIYAGVIENLKDDKKDNETGYFYINGQNSLIGKKANAKLCWDESKRYEKVENKNGCFIVQEKEKCQPYLIKFKTDEFTGRIIPSDDLYFNLGQYPFPLPSNSIQNMGFCIMSPCETDAAFNLIRNTTEVWEQQAMTKINLDLNNMTEFNNSYCNKESSFESELEFNIIANPKEYLPFLDTTHYSFCRQIPISPFKPIHMDRADICLYDKNNLLQNGSIPNIIIELKNERANKNAYEQVVRYLKWLEKISPKEIFNKINAYIVAPDFYIKKEKIDVNYVNKIKCWSLLKKDYYDIK